MTELDAPTPAPAFARVATEQWSCVWTTGAVSRRSRERLDDRSSPGSTASASAREAPDSRWVEP